MTILRERISWRLAGAGRLRSSTDLAPEERVNVARAVTALRKRYGNGRKLAAALKSSLRSVQRATGRNPKPSAILAVRVAKLAGVGVDKILRGRWPKDGACPMCGRMRGSLDA